MKSYNFFLTLACMGFMGLSTACSDSDEPRHNDEGSKVELPAHRMFVLNQGLWGMNDASLAFMDPDKKSATIDDIFLLQNGRHLGDTGNAMIRSGNNIYIAVHTSNYVTKLNSAGVETGRLTFTDNNDLLGGVRYIAASGDNLYATFYGGYLMKIDASTMSVSSTVSTPAANCEGIGLYNGNLYVADAYEITLSVPEWSDTPQPTYIYHNKVMVVNADNLQVSSTVEVGPNPNKIFVAEGRVFVQCLGNYFDRGNELWMINPSDGNKATLIGAATEAAVYGGNVFMALSETDWSTYTTTTTFSRYNLHDGKLYNQSGLRDVPAQLTGEVVSMMSADPSTGDIYVGVTHYASSEGDIYRFDSTGAFVESFSSEGMHPVAAAYFD